MSKWRIYYGDGSAYSGSTEKEAINAPTINVQVIWIENPKRSQGGGIVTGRDMYLYKSDRWFGCDEAGFYDYLFHYPGPKAVLFGRTMGREEDYNEIVQKAIREKLGA